MTIQRQYLLPNCTLTLEGLSSSSTVGAQNLRPSLDTLMRFECHFEKLDQTLVGGLDFLESLIQATSECTQSWMSGVQHVRVKRRQLQSDHVQLQPSDDGNFQMSVPSALLSDAPSVDEPVDVKLTTVQLFDLAEALDQLLADAQTLPNLSSNIRPLSRREALSGQSLTKRSAPLALGTVGFAIAATALYFIPAPVVPRPKDEPVPVTTPVVPGTASPSPEAGETTETPDANTEPEASPEATATPEPAETPAPEDAP